MKKTSVSILLVALAVLCNGSAESERQLQFGFDDEEEAFIAWEDIEAGAPEDQLAIEAISDEDILSFGRQAEGIIRTIISDTSFFVYFDSDSTSQSTSISFDDTDYCNELLLVPNGGTVEMTPDYLEVNLSFMELLELRKTRIKTVNDGKRIAWRGKFKLPKSHYYAVFNYDETIMACNGPYTTSGSGRCSFETPTTTDIILILRGRVSLVTGRAFITFAKAKSMETALGARDPDGSSNTGFIISQSLVTDLEDALGTTLGEYVTGLANVQRAETTLPGLNDALAAEFGAEGGYEVTVG